MSDFEDMINSVLGDPAQMEKIAGIAKSLMGAEGADASASCSSAGAGSLPPSGGFGLDSAMLGRLSSLMNSAPQNGNDKKALLEAMKPYLSEKRRQKMDKALRIARLAKIAGIAMGEMEEKSDV